VFKLYEHTLIISLKNFRPALNLKFNHMARVLFDSETPVLHNLPIIQLTQVNKLLVI